MIFYMLPCALIALTVVIVIVVFCVYGSCFAALLFLLLFHCNLVFNYDSVLPFFLFAAAAAVLFCC